MTYEAEFKLCKDLKKAFNVRNCYLFKLSSVVKMQRCVRRSKGGYYVVTNCSLEVRYEA